MNQDEFRDKIARICENLARSEADFHMWTYKPVPYGGMGITDGALKFNVFPKDDGKLYIRLDDEGFQGVYQNDLKIPVIVVSASRTEKALASDIAKRFIPGARLAYTELLKRKADHEAYLASVQANKATILGINPELFYYDERCQRNPDKTEVQIDCRNIYGRVRVTGTGMRFEAFSVSFEQGRIMLQALSKAINSQEHQKIVLDLIKEWDFEMVNWEISLDDLETETAEQMTRDELCNTLLDLELSNTIHQLPGKRFRIVRDDELTVSLVCNACAGDYEYTKAEIAQGFHTRFGYKVPIVYDPARPFICASCNDAARGL